MTRTRAPAPPAAPRKGAAISSSTKSAVTKASTTAKKTTSKPTAAPAKKLTGSRSPTPTSRDHVASQHLSARPSLSTPSTAEHRSASLARADNLLDDNTHDPGFLSNDEVFDEADQAQHLQLLEQAAILERIRNMPTVETHPDFDGKHCVECDVIIPPARLKLSRVRCVDCQTDLEEAARRRSLLTAR